MANTTNARGGGDAPPEPIPTPVEPEPEPTPGEVTVADGKPFDESVMNNNIKGLLDSWKSDEENQAKQRQGLEDQLASMFLRWADQEHTLALRTADAGAILVNRTGNNAATLDNLVYVSNMNAAAAMEAKVANELRSVATQAVEAAVAATSQTSAAAQGTTGVAQGALQVQNPIELAQVLTNNNTIQAALLATMADINAALKVLLAETTGKAVVTA